MMKIKFSSALVLIGLLAAVHGKSFAELVTLQNGTATFSQGLGGSFSVDDVINGVIGDTGDPEGWAILLGTSTNAQTAVWETVSDVSGPGLKFDLHQAYGGNHLLGRFRLSITTDDRSLFADGLNSGGDVTANWTVLTGATVSGTGGETFTVQPDNSILVSGTKPTTSVYNVQFTGPFSGITGIRLEAMLDASLPTSGPGRQNNGNFVLSEMEVNAIPEPSSFALFAIATMGMLGASWRRQKRKQAA